MERENNQKKKNEQFTPPVNQILQIKIKTSFNHCPIKVYGKNKNKCDYYLDHLFLYSILGTFPRN